MTLYIRGQYRCINLHASYKISTLYSLEDKQKNQSLIPVLY